MSKLPITPSSVATDNIQNQPDQVKNQSTILKQVFDKYGIDDKDYINNTLIPDLNGDDGSKRIGHNSASITADNVAEALEENRQAIDNPTNVLTLDNTTPYAPTANYHPSTKKYVDDAAFNGVPLGLADQFLKTNSTADGVEYSDIPNDNKTRSEQNQKRSLQNTVMIEELQIDAGISSRVGKSTESFYDYNGAERRYSIGELDTTKGYAETVTTATDNLDITSMNSGVFADFKVGQEVTLQDGTTVTNSVTNGDISDGTTGWVGVGGNLSVANNILKITNTGSTQNIRAEQDLGFKATNESFFSNARFKVDTSCVSITIYLRDGDDDTTILKRITSPTINVWYDLSEVSESITTTNNLKILLQADFIGGGGALEIDGNAGVFAINMSNGISDYLTILGYTTDEQQKQFMLDIVQAQGYFTETSITQKENLTIQALSDPTITFTTNITGTYTAGANVYRSNISDDWGFGVFGSDAFTKSLIHFDGVDGSTIFTDESGKTWTPNNNAQLDTAFKKFGTASGLFDGVADWIETPSDNDFNFLNEDFTVECWFKKLANGVNGFILGKNNAAFDNNDSSFYIKTTTGNIIQAVVYDSQNEIGNTLATTTTITDTNFHHVALVRNGNDLILFLDGLQEDTFNFTGLTTQESSGKLSIGRSGEFNGQYFNGHVDEFRISKGIARWTTNFTPPTVAYDDVVGIPLTDVDLRMNIEPFNDVKSIVAWSLLTDIAGVTNTGYLSIVDELANESYTALVNSDIDLGTDREYLSTGSVTTADSKVTYKASLTKNLTTDNVEIKLIYGGVA